MTRSARYGILSTQAPTRCGIATFSAALKNSLNLQGHEVVSVRIVHDDAPANEGARNWVPNTGRALNDMADELNHQEVVFIQHEFGLYGGPDGSEILQLMEKLYVPTIVIVHTVLPIPSNNQHHILRAITEMADGVVVMTESARRTLIDVYGVEISKIEVIPHGASIDRPQLPATLTPRPIILTWGLIGPGKGIEWVLDAMVGFKNLVPPPLYVIAGQTHPKVLASDGDSYRHSLEQRVIENGVEELVVFDNSYRDLRSLGRLIAAAAVVVLPYDSKDQAVSGVLVDAVAAGRPVIATEFPHAVELLTADVGITVPHKNPLRLFIALSRVLCEPSVAQTLTAGANRIAPQLSWDAVARQYSNFASRLLLTSSIGAL
jgi:glycosyltransferase involved in cell wall biosynthesis